MLRITRRHHAALSSMRILCCACLSACLSATLLVGFSLHAPLHASVPLSRITQNCAPPLTSSRRTPYSSRHQFASRAFLAHLLRLRIVRYHSSFALHSNMYAVSYDCCDGGIGGGSGVSVSVNIGVNIDVTSDGGNVTAAIIDARARIRSAHMLPHLMLFACAARARRGTLVHLWFSLHLSFRS